MTYLPAKPSSGAGSLAGADLITITRGGVAMQATLATLQAFVLGSGSGSTGSTGGTGSTGSPGPASNLLANQNDLTAGWQVLSDV